ncbi:MAG: sugar ABC transporter permease [Clostridia bacterium]|nr:sugar ABC transporter permease [Clostridia bacterium]
MKKLRKDKTKSKLENILGYSFMMPWIVGFVIFTALPFFYTIYLSMFDVELTVRGWELTWNSFNNYGIAFLRNAVFVPSLIDFIIYQLSYVPVIIVISFILAWMLNQKIRFRAGFRLIYFLPVIIMSGSVMQQLMDTGNTNLGSIEGSIIYKIIISYSVFLAQGMDYLFENFTMVLWFTGIPIILMISGLSKINESLYEAARIDGASSWQMLWKITLPHMKHFILVATIFTIVQLGMYSLNPIYTMIRDAIYNTTAGLGLASSFAWIYTFVVLLIVLIAFTIFKDRERRKGND